MLGEQTINVGRIEFLSSLPSDQSQTSIRIRESVRDYIRDENVPIETNLTQVESADEFFDAIERIVVQATEDGQGVVLQIDAHGAQQGIELSSGDLVTWDSLKEALTKLNRATRFNLLVVLSTCYGAHMIGASSPLEESPFWGIVGPKEEIEAGPLMDGLVAFYKTWIEERSGDRAVDALNEHAEGEDPFYFTTAERFFGSRYLDFLKKNQINAQTIADQARERHNKMKKKNGPWRRPSVAAVKRQVWADHLGFFEQCKSTYFMIDQFPEVSDRIGIELEDVKSQL
ncbi:MAG: hypothetical protein HN856_16805 [Gammaproteobacteria bacterium]|nr:hypothetical protein [Gammaproteobacteria bacterium]